METEDEEEESVWYLSKLAHDESYLIKLNLEEMEKFMDDPAVKGNESALPLLRNTRRKIKNREYARISRQKAKLRLDCLEREILRLEIVNRR